MIPPTRWTTQETRREAALISAGPSESNFPPQAAPPRADAVGMSASRSPDAWATPLPRQPFVVTPFGPQELPEYVIDGGSALCSAFKGMKGVLMFTDASIEFARDRSFGRGLDGIWTYGDLLSYSLKRGLFMHVLALRPLGGKTLRFRIGGQLAVNARHILDAKGVKRR